MEPADNEKPVLTCPVVKTFCYETSGIYAIPLLKAVDNYFITQTSFAISGATIRSGTGSDASGKFLPGKSTITWSVTDQSGNTSTCSTFVEVNPALLVEIPAVKVLPSGVNAMTVYPGYTPAEVITLTAKASGGSPAYSYLWSNGGKSVSTSVNPLSETNYSVIATDAKGCQSTGTTTVRVVDVAYSKKDKEYVIMCKKGETTQTKYKDVEEELKKGNLLGSCVTTSKKDKKTKKSATGKTGDFVRSETEMLQLKAWPNSSSSFFNLSVKTNLGTKISLVAYDAVGKIVEVRSMAAGVIQLGEKYAPGVYIISIRQGDETAQVKLIKR